MKTKMKKSTIWISLLLISINAFSYEWDSIGPTSITVNNFHVISYNIDIEIICANEGLYINEGNEWNQYSNSELPAIAAVGLDPNNLLVLMGNGSWSDGIYKFNLTTHLFEIVEWIAFPNFLKYCEYDEMYYVGGEYGFWKSIDGLNFTAVPYFNSMKCMAFAYFDNHFVVSADLRPRWSDDGGNTWNMASYDSPSGVSLDFDSDGKLYGMLPGPSYSSGVWRSIDFGATWDVEFWSLDMWSLKVDSEDNLFVSWQENRGVAHWIPETCLLVSYKDGLPNHNVNMLTTHPTIGYNNIVACTDGGTYILKDYVVDVKGIVDEETVVLTNSPNPFSNSTLIEFMTNENTYSKLVIYDINGNVIETLFEGYVEANRKYKIEFISKNINNGVYYCCFTSSNNTRIIQKMVVAK